MDGRNNYAMDAGTARGIDVGDEFTLYDDPEPSKTSSVLGTFVVREAHPFRSTLVPFPSTSGFELQKPAFALLTKAGNTHDLPVYVVEHTELSPVFESVAQKMHHVRPDRPRILLVEKEKAMLIIDFDRNLNKVVFDIRILDESVAPPSGNWQRIPFSVELEESELHPILDAAAHFHRHLSRSDKHHDLQKNVRFELTEVKQLEEEYDEDLNPKIEPVGDNLNQNGIVNLVAGGQAKGMYGIKILNDTPIPLYAVLLYFDTSDLSITSLYQPPPPDQRKLDPPLAPNGFMMLGYGTGGEAPFIFTLNGGQDLEFGFFKLFLSTECVDLSNIEQSSPFKSTRTLGRAEAFATISTWDTVLVTVVLRKE